MFELFLSSGRSGVAQNQGILPGTVSPVGETHRSFQITDCSPREQNDYSRTLKIPYTVAVVCSCLDQSGSVRDVERGGKTKTLQRLSIWRSRCWWVVPNRLRKLALSECSGCFRTILLLNSHVKLWNHSPVYGRGNRSKEKSGHFSKVNSW